MYCYNCGAKLTKSDKCPNCGAGVGKYKKISYASNCLYNEGLSKAGVRDLSGAAECLRASIRLNKYNIDARNLYGLVCYETGEVVEALSQWVISSNLQPKNNAASRYIKEVQSSQNRLQALEQSIKKYNRALEYCRQGSLDLAVIQLRKVLQLNPKYLRARQLLSLLYINSGDYRNAGKELKRCKKIDLNNTTTLRYIAEVEEQTLPENLEKSGKTEELTDDTNVIKYRDGNETIIQPAGAVNPPVSQTTSNLPSTLLNIGIGLLVGAAIVGFFVLPAQVQKVRTDSENQLKIVGEQSDAKTATISEQTQQIDDLTSQNEELQSQVDTYKASAESLTDDDSLFRAVNAYLTDSTDIGTIADEFSKINYSDVEKSASTEYKNLYTTLLGILQSRLVEYYYNTGYTAYEGADYITSIQDLTLALGYADKDNDSNYAAIEYYLADSYYLQYRDADASAKSQYSDNLSTAQRYFNAVRNDFGDSYLARDAATRLQEISLIKSQTSSDESTGSNADGTAGTADLQD